MRAADINLEELFMRYLLKKVQKLAFHLRFQIGWML